MVSRVPKSVTDAFLILKGRRHGDPEEAQALLNRTPNPRAAARHEARSRVKRKVRSRLMGSNVLLGDGRWRR